MKFGLPKVGVFIPCVAEHARYLPALLRKLRRGYVQPHRVAVVVSNLSGRKCRKLQQEVRLRTFDRSIEAGPARQMAYEMLSDCDVICYQDADDMPSLNRVEYVQELFAKPWVNAFNHSYRTTNWSWMDRQDDCQKAFPGDKAWHLSFPNGKIEDSAQHSAFGAVLEFPVHAGVVSVRRSVLETVQWKASEDLPDKTHFEDWYFCFECLYELKHTHWFSKAVLYKYRPPDGWPKESFLTRLLRWAYVPNSWVR